LPSGEQVLPSGEHVLPSGEQALPSGKQVLPSGEQVLPSGVVFQRRNLTERQFTAVTSEREDFRFRQMFFRPMAHQAFRILEEIIAQTTSEEKIIEKLSGEIFKQWPLAGEFVEFEYLPKIHQFWQIGVLAKMTIFGNLSDLPDSNSPNCDPS
jgi:hypothetical protein